MSETVTVVFWLFFTVFMLISWVVCVSSRTFQTVLLKVAHVLFIFSLLWNCLFFTRILLHFSKFAEMFISKWEKRGTSGSLNYLLHPFSAC